MGMYDCATCNEPRCEHVIADMDDLSEQLSNWQESGDRMAREIDKLKKENRELRQFIKRWTEVIKEQLDKNMEIDDD